MMARTLRQLRLTSLVPCALAMSACGRATPGASHVAPPTDAIAAVDQHDTVKVDLRQSTTEPAATILDLAEISSLSEWDGKVVTICAQVEDAKPWPQMHATDVWVRLPDSCRPLGGRRCAVTGRLTLIAKAHYYRSINEDRPPDQPVQDFGSGWWPDFYELTP